MSETGWNDRLYYPNHLVDYYRKPTRLVVRTDKKGRITAAWLQWGDYDPCGRYDWTTYEHWRCG